MKIYLLTFQIKNKKMCHVKCYTNSFLWTSPFWPLCSCKGSKELKKHTSLCNTDAKPNINVNVSGQRVHSTELWQILAPLDGARWAYLSITLASMMLQYTDPEVYGQNNMDALVCKRYVQRKTEHGTIPIDVQTISVLLMVKQSISQVYSM